MIKYLGSKRSLLPIIQRIVQAVPNARSVIDLFSGTARVGHALKSCGLQVLSNDHNTYSATLARCYVEADLDRVERDARQLIDELSRLPGQAGYFTETFCVKSRFFRPKNGERVDAIREAIQEKSLDRTLEAVLLVSLMEAADRVDSTVGLQMAYLKQWAPRALNDLTLRFPDVLPASVFGACRATQHEATDAVREFAADVIYLDPPYNQHSYLGNYHIWESLVRWDKPDVYGVACKRIDVRARKSAFNLKTRFKDALADVVQNSRCRVLIVSFNNEGYIARPEMEKMLSERGPVYVLATDYKRYVGAQIGIYSPSGDPVGSVSHVRNLEYLYIVDIEGTGVAWPTLIGQLAIKPRDTSASPATRAPTQQRLF